MKKKTMFQLGMVFGSVAVLFAFMLRRLRFSADDWQYTLPNGYSMLCLGENRTALWKREGTSLKTVVAPPVVSFCHNARYVGCVRTAGSLRLYYLIDTLQRETYGPFSSEETFAREAEQAGAAGLGAWQSTAAMPAGAQPLGK